MSEAELTALLDRLLALPVETEWVEFKEAKQNFDSDDLGKYFSALSNEANLHRQPCAWLVFGVKDRPRQIVGSQFRNNPVSLQSLKQEVSTHLSPNLTFVDVHVLQRPEGRVLLFQIPSAPAGMPVSWKMHMYGRNGESLAGLSIEKIERIRRQTTRADWSAELVPDTGMDDLDVEALALGRQKYREKHEGNTRLLAEEATWDGAKFLDKLKLRINGQRRIRILEDMARSLYREWFAHFRYPGHESVPLVDSPLGQIPQGWEVIPFTEIADVLNGGTPKTDVADYWNGEIPFFTPRDAPDSFYVQDADKHVTELGLSKCASQLYPPGTVFITARGTVGKVALPSVPMAMNQSCYALRGKTGISQRFLFLMTLQQVDYLKTNTGGATFDTIVVDTFRRMQVAKPLLDLITQFTSHVDAVFEQINTLQRQTANLRRTRDLLLPRLLSGQVALAAVES